MILLPEMCEIKKIFYLEEDILKIFEFKVSD